MILIYILVLWWSRWWDYGITFVLRFFWHFFELDWFDLPSFLATSIKVYENFYSCHVSQSYCQSIMLFHIHLLLWNKTTLAGRKECSEMVIINVNVSMCPQLVFIHFHFIRQADCYSPYHCCSKCPTGAKKVSKKCKMGWEMTFHFFLKCMDFSA